MGLKRRLIILALLACLVTPWLSVGPVSAQIAPSDGGSGGGTTTTTSTCTDSNCVVTLPDVDQSRDPALTKGGKYGGLFTNYINPFIVFLSAAVGVVVVIAIIWGAIEYASAGGDPQKAAKARNRIRNAVVALIAYLFLYAILQWLIPGGLGG